MKKISTLLAIVLMSFQTANALIVSIDGEDEIPEEGIELTITEAEEDPLSGEQVMELSGNLLASSQLTVKITRSEKEVKDEFCCGEKCTSGNSDIEETLQFNVNGMENWYLHYYPKEKSDVTIEYVFSDETDTLKMTVHYLYGTEDIEAVEAEQHSRAIYTMTGAQTGYEDIDQAPAGIYIQGGKKIAKTTY